VAPASELDSETYTGELEQKSREFLKLYTEKRHLEDELQRKVFELSLINGLTASLLSTMNLEEILYRILVGVTAKEGLGFNRAFLLLVNEKAQVLEGKMAIGPSSLEEAIRIWTELSDRHLTYHDLLAAFDSGWPEHDAHVNRLVRQIRVPLDDRSHVLIDLLMQTQPEVIGPGGTRSHPDSGTILDLLGVVRSAAAPLVYRKRQLGLLMADNLISHKPISEDDLRILETFANYASAAIEHSRLYEEVRLRIKESERHIVELEAMQNRLMRSKKLSDLGELASKMAHELRTPLVSIGGFANGLLKRHSPESADYEELKIIVDEVLRLEAIIRNVLAYVSPGFPRTQPTDLRELSDKVLRLMQGVFEARRIEVSTQYFNAVPRVSVDPEQIQLVLTAIINNAMESMPDGGRLTLAIQNGQGFIRLSIADTGAGIREEDLEKVFDAFFTTKSLGSGLGLNIASQIIANHNGSIYAESQVGKGSTFFVNFPAGPHFEEENP
jgi:signal transduction histidine kinase